VKSPAPAGLPVSLPIRVTSAEHEAHGPAERGLRWGLIGASDIADTRVIPALRELGHVVVGVVSSSAERAAAYAHANSIDWGTTDSEALLGRDDVDAVYISTTNDRHHEQTLAAAAAGKHVLCEKPLALSLEQAWEMVDACEREGVTLAINHHLPAAGTHRAIRRLVAEGAVGEPLAVRVFHAGLLPQRLRGWRLTAPDRGAGVILDITTHDAAAVHAILGREPLEAAAVAVRQGPWDAAAEDAVVAALRYEGEVLVQTHDAYTLSHAGNALEVHGRDGSIVAAGVMAPEPAGHIVLRTSVGEHDVAPADRRGLYEVALEAFAGAVRGLGRPVVDGRDGVRALAIALAVKRAAETGQTIPVRWQRSGR
jgi:1,5-anhydro-D-fructose reductase (1,5-anhydro-D-mannitol-forming)